MALFFTPEIVFELHSANFVFIMCIIGCILLHTRRLLLLYLTLFLSIIWNLFVKCQNNMIAVRFYSLSFSLMIPVICHCRLLCTNFVSAQKKKKNYEQIIHTALLFLYD